MKPNVSERTVLQYVKLDFQGDWEYSADSFAFRPVGKVADLLVVREGATGILETYWFHVRRRPDPPNGGFFPTDGVVVPREENIVYIPERCAKRENGDLTKCGDAKG